MAPDARTTTLLAAIHRILVIGASRSGVSAAVVLARLGKAVTLSDRRPLTQLSSAEEAAREGIAFASEEGALTLLPSIDLVVKSPGVPGEIALVSEARRRGIPVWSEIELAYALCVNPFDAVTGTNGKTTTTALLGHLFATAGRPVRVLGNIGTAATSALGDVSPDEEIVLEVSSFQLEDVHEFRPAAAVFLNLTPDHLDRHGSMERYLACKANLFARQGPSDVAILNLADPAVAGLGRELAARPAGPRVLFFSALGRGPLPIERVGSGDAAGSRSGGRVRTGDVLADSWVEHGWLHLLGQPGLPMAELQLRGLHNMENCLAAATAGLARGLERDSVLEGLRSFAGVAHRLERAGIVHGVTYVNDSKATNVEATLKALDAYPERTHLILGGRDKASDYRPVARASADTCVAVYLIGEATPLIEAAFAEVREREGRTGVPVPQALGDLETAVRAAAGRARQGDTVLLAPACASFDQYDNFEERGEHFRAIVGRLSRIAGERGGS